MINYRDYTVVYADADEKYVKNVVLFGKSSDDYIYSAKECAEDQKIDKTTLMDLLHKGVVISYENAFYTPVFYKENAGAVEITIATAIATGASTAVVLHSSEYSEE